MSRRAVSLALALGGACGPAWAHDVRPGVVSVVEAEPGRWRVRITPAQDGGGPAVDPRPAWPAGCREAPGSTLVCPDGMHGVVRLPALRERRVTFLLHLAPREAPPQAWWLREGQDAVFLGAPPATGARADFWRGVDRGGRTAVLAPVWALAVASAPWWGVVVGALACAWLPALGAPALAGVPAVSTAVLAGGWAALLARRRLVGDAPLDRGRAAVVWVVFVGLAAGAHAGADVAPVSVASLAGMATPWLAAAAGWGVIGRWRATRVAAAALGAVGAAVAGLGLAGG